MRLSTGEVLGGVAAFIPGLSSITGIIQAVQYSNKIKKLEVQIVAEKTKGVATPLLVALEKEKSCCRSLLITSIIQIIPVVNLVSAIVSAIFLSRLSAARENPPVITPVGGNPPPAVTPTGGNPPPVKPTVVKPVAPIPLDNSNVRSPEKLLNLIKSGDCLVKTLKSFNYIIDCLFNPAAPENRVRIRPLGMVECEELRNQALALEQAGKGKIDLKTLDPSKIITVFKNRVLNLTNFTYETIPSKKNITHTKSTSTTLIPKSGMTKLFNDPNGNFSIGFAFNFKKCKEAKFSFFKIDGHTNLQWWLESTFTNLDGTKKPRFTKEKIQNYKERMADNFQDLKDFVNREGAYAPGGKGFIPKLDPLHGEFDAHNELYAKVSKEALEGLTINDKFDRPYTRVRAICIKLALEKKLGIVDLPIVFINEKKAPTIYTPEMQKADIDFILRDYINDNGVKIDENEDIPGLNGNCRVTYAELIKYANIDYSAY